ncbi:MAG: hypothetical protein HQM12_15180 [SAR324 cluster bacterium]|nr:hypothetical protein [SAR324 cluster bacterium]
MPISLDKGQSEQTQPTQGPIQSKTKNEQNSINVTNQEATFTCPVCFSQDFLCLEKDVYDTKLKCKQCQKIIHFRIDTKMVLGIMGPKGHHLSKIEDDAIQEDRICGECKYYSSIAKSKGIWIGLELWMGLVLCIGLVISTTFTGMLWFFGTISQSSIPIVFCCSLVGLGFILAAIFIVWPVSGTNRAGRYLER